MKKAWVKATKTKSVDNEQLVKVEISPSAIKGFSYIVFPQK